MPQPVSPDPTVPPIRTKAARWWMRGALLLFGCALALLVGEVLIRVVAREGPIYTFRDREIGRRFTRSWEGDVYVEEAGRVVHQRFNREGMRDRDWPTAKAPGERRVAVLGDSMVAALATEEERRFTSGVRYSRSDVLQPPIEALPPGETQNWGVSGSSPALAVRLLETRVTAYAPDRVVLVWFVGNDLGDDWPPLGGRRFAAADLAADGSLTWRPFEDASSPLSEWLARNSRLYVWQKRMLSRLGDEGAGGTRPGLRALEVPSAPVLVDAWRMAEAVLARFASATGAMGGEARGAVLVLPSAEQVYDDLWARTEADARAQGRAVERWGAQARLEAASKRLGLAFHAERFAPGLQLARPGDHVFLGGTGHLNERGHTQVRASLERLLAGMVPVIR